MSQGPDTRREEDGGVERTDLSGLRKRGGGLKLPGLKRWRRWSGLSQRQLADKVDVPLHYVQRVEQDKRGCNLRVALNMANVLGVDLQELLLAGAVEEEDAAAGAVVVREPTRPQLGSARYLHETYLKVILKREVGSAYSVLGERAFESHIRSLPVEEVVEIISKRKRELEFVKEELASEEELHPQARLFLEKLVRERPAEDLRVLAVRRAREPSEEGHERLTQAMRELL
jgi:DNA-binding XRE family transcriptional regulator